MSAGEYVVLLLLFCQATHAKLAAGLFAVATGVFLIESIGDRLRSTHCSACSDDKMATPVSCPLEHACMADHRLGARESELGRHPGRQCRWRSGFQRKRERERRCASPTTAIGMVVGPSCQNSKTHKNGAADVTAESSSPESMWSEPSNRHPTKEMRPRVIA